MRRTLAVIAIFAVSIAGGAVFALSRDASAHAGLIFPGITIGGIPVGGLRPGAAKTTVQASADRRLAQTLRLHLGNERASFTHAELGLRADADEAVAGAYALARRGSWFTRARWRVAVARRGADVPLRFDLDEAGLRRVVQSLAGRLTARPRNAEVIVSAGRVVISRPSRAGHTLDVDATASRIVAAMDAGAVDADAVVSVVEPDFTTEEAQELQAPLASFTTRMVNNPNRISNIALAASFIRGTILAPGDAFSYNKIVGPRTTERGFKEAPVLINDELVPGDGGGVCQVSSTLFNVALLADFEILNRTNHSRPVAYLPLGRDATVDYGMIDLAFRNLTGRHVLLWAYVSGNRLTITAFGTPTPGKQVGIQVTDREEIPPPGGTVTKKDPELEEGKVVTREAQPGYRAKTWRIVMMEGTVVRRELVARSLYRPVPRTIKIGAKKTKQVSSRH